MTNTKIEAKQIADRLFNEAVKLTKTIPAGEIGGLHNLIDQPAGEGIGAFEDTDGHLYADRAVDGGGNLDRERGLAFLLRVPGHPLWDEEFPEPKDFRVWLDKNKLEIPAAEEVFLRHVDEEDEAEILAELREALLADADALECLRKDLIALLCPAPGADQWAREECRRGLLDAVEDFLERRELGQDQE